MAKRLFDILSAFLFLVLAFPFLLIISVFILLDSKGGLFFRQTRVGVNGEDFKLYKFRTMRTSAESSGQLTVGMKDPRITKVGGFLRRYKLDEIPQLLNILKGDMSIVGPRPEVRKYVSLYNPEQLKVLSVKPGLTDLASIQYIKENELLGASINPEETYIKEIMPDKLKLNLIYIEKASFWYDIKLIFKTVGKLF